MEKERREESLLVTSFEACLLRVVEKERREEKRACCWSRALKLACCLFVVMEKERREEKSHSLYQ